MADGSLQPILARTPVRIEASRLLRTLRPLRRWTLRGGPAVADAIQAAFGVAAPRTACRSAVNEDGSRAALWLGPDEWLLLAEDDGAQPGDPEAALRQVLAALPHSLVDVSHRQVALEVSGSDSALLLNSGGCPLDLDPEAFPVGMCTRTVLAKAEIILWRTQPGTFHVEVWRSFAAYVSAWLAEATRGLTE
ncbi:MAG: sarcosine oxidase subunit gamma [Proteobacteria bacterium]|nr:sarcosine oxidase subunit gamma [Pseudomonadota bacterium]